MTAERGGKRAWWIEAHVSDHDARGRAWFQGVSAYTKSFVEKPADPSELHLTIAYFGTHVTRMQAVETFWAMRWSDRHVPARVTLGGVAFFDEGAVVAELADGRPRERLIAVMEHTYDLAAAIKGKGKPIPRYAALRPHVTLGKTSLRTVKTGDVYAANLRLRAATLVLDEVRLCAWDKESGAEVIDRHTRRRDPA